MESMRPRTVAFVLSLLALLSLAGCLKSFEAPSAVYVAGLDLQAEAVRAQSLTLNVTTLLDNRGEGETGELKLIAKAYDEGTGFLVVTNETLAGRVPGAHSTQVSQQLTLPREGAVRLEVQLFVDGERLQQASVTARNLQALKPDAHETGLKISDMDFLVKDTNGGKPTIRADLYFTNEADHPSEDVRVQLKAREITTGLVADTAWLDTGTIPAARTHIRTANLTVPDGYNYQVEILTWRDDVIVDRATGHVQLAPTFEKPKDQEVVITNPNLQDFTSGRSYSGKLSAADGAPMGASFDEYAYDRAPHHGESAAAVPGVGAIALVVAALGAAVLLPRGWRHE